MCLISLRVNWLSLTWMKTKINNFQIFYPFKICLHLHWIYFRFPFIFYEHLPKVFLFTQISGRFFSYTVLDKLTSRQVRSTKNAYDLTDESHATNNELWMAELKREVTRLMQHLNPVYNSKWGHFDSDPYIFAYKPDSQEPDRDVTSFPLAVPALCNSLSSLLKKKKKETQETQNQ